MLKWITATLSLSLLTACASLEPEPCTAEWVEWKTERVFSDFTRAHRSDLNQLRSFSETLADGGIGPMTALRLPAMTETFKDLALAFRDDTLPELNAAVQQCGTPQKLIPAFSKFLEDQGVEDSVLEWIDLLGTLVSEN